MGKNKGASSLIWAILDKGMTNALALVISIVLARLIDPSEYGILATASIFTILLTIFVEPGMTSGLIQKKSSDKLDFSTILVFNLVLGIGLYFLLFVCSPFISQWFEMPALSMVIKVAGLQIVVGAINSVQIAYVQKNMMFKRYCVCSLSSLIISSVVAVAMAYSGMGVWALVAYHLLKQIIVTIVTNILFRCRFGLRFSKERFKQMFPFASKMLLSKFVDQGYVECTQIILSKLYSSTQLAFYNKGKSFPDLVINTINSALANVMFPYFSGLQDDKERLYDSIRFSVKMSSFICLPMMFGLCACADNFVYAVLTERWSGSIPFLRLTCVYYFWIPFSNIIRQSLKGIGKGSAVVKLEVVKLALSIASLVTFLKLLQSPLAIAVSVVFSYTACFCIEWAVANKRLDYAVKHIFADFAPSFFASLLMGCVVFAVGLLNYLPIVELIIQVFAGISCYLIVAVALKYPQMQYLLNMIRGVDRNKKKDARLSEGEN